VDLDVGDTDSSGNRNCGTPDAYFLSTMVHIEVINYGYNEDSDL